MQSSWLSLTKIIATLAIVGAAIIGVLVALNLISDAVARETFIKTGWVLLIVGVTSGLLLAMGSKQK